MPIHLPLRITRHYELQKHLMLVLFTSERSLPKAPKAIHHTVERPDGWDFGRWVRYIKLRK